MEKLRVYFDRQGNTLSVWFDDPKKESVCEETDDDMVLVKDRRGRVIGFERLNYLSAKQRKEVSTFPWKWKWVEDYSGSVSGSMPVSTAMRNSSGLASHAAE